MLCFKWKIKFKIQIQHSKTQHRLKADNSTFNIQHSKMTIREAQQAVDTWIKTYGVRYFSELTNMACLTEEVGELARIMARRYGDQSFKEGENQDPSEEMADILWVLMALANQTGVDLTEALQKSIEKKTKRDATRHKNNPKLTADKKEKDL